MSRTDFSTESENDRYVSPYVPWETRQATSRVDPGFPARRPLPSKTIARGAPVWQPPDIYCDDLIGEEYEKMRKAVLEFTDDDAAKTTEYLDWTLQTPLNERYTDWAKNLYKESRRCGDEESAYFNHGLMTELEHDAILFYDEGDARMAISLYRMEGDENYYVECLDPFAPMWGGDPRIERKSAENEERAYIRTVLWQAAQDAKRKEEAAQAELEQVTEGFSESSSVSGELDSTSQCNPPSRLVAQDDEAEVEEMEWLRSLESTLQQPTSMKPLILQMVRSTVRKPENRNDAEAHGSEEEVD